MQTIITRDVLIEELGRIPLSNYPKLFQILKNFENEEITIDYNAKIDGILENILSLKGIGTRRNYVQGNYPVTSSR